MPNNCRRCRMPGCDGTCPPDYDRPGQPGGMFSGPMTESRGAASVTLDTIIAKAAQEVLGGDWEHGTPQRIARAVTEALLAKGEIREQGISAYTWKRSLVVPLPLEGS